jgi:TPR repeat protein
VKLFGTLADNNNSMARYWLVHMTDLGLGVPSDPAKAIDLYNKAAEQNVDAAELRPGTIGAPLLERSKIRDGLAAPRLGHSFKRAS